MSKSTKNYDLTYELFKANELMSKRSKSAYRCHTTTQLYMQAYRGTALRLLMSRSVIRFHWKIEFRTYGYDVSNQQPVKEPHYMQMVINEKVSAGVAVVMVSRLWSADLQNEINKLGIVPTRIEVKLRTLD